MRAFSVAGSSPASVAIMAFGAAGASPAGSSSSFVVVAPAVAAWVALLRRALVRAAAEFAILFVVLSLLVHPPI